MATTTLVDQPTSSNRRAEGGRRSTTGAVLAGFGALLFVLSLMTRFYVSPTLAVAPVDQNSVTSLQAKGATLFDTATLAPITTDLSIKARVVGDVKAADSAPDGTDVWVNTTTIKSADGVIRSQSVKRAAFDAKSGAAVNCCDNFMETENGVRTKVNRTGLIYKFPFSTAKKTYQMWDDTAAKAVPTRYTGSTSIQGKKMYVFVNDVPATVVGSQDVPASVIGLPGNDNVSADSYYQNHTTYYVEPVTGAIVNQVSDTKAWFDYQGHQLVTTDAHITFTPKQVDDMINLLGSQPSMLAATQGYLPWVGVVIGLLMIGFGAALTRRPRTA